MQRYPVHTGRLHRRRPNTASLQQSANEWRSLVNVAKLRTDSASRSSGTATNIWLAPTSIPAASGCRTAKSWTLFFLVVAIFVLPDIPVGCPWCEESELPIEIVALRERHHKTVRDQGPTLTSGLRYRAPMSTRAVAVISPVPLSSQAQRSFLCGSVVCTLTRSRPTRRYKRAA